MTDPTAARTPDELLADALGRIAPEADLSNVDPDEPLAEAFDLDSMDMMAVLETLQELSGVRIPDRDAPKLSTLAGVRAYLTHPPSRG